MPRTFTSLTDILAHGADTVIDVRSPAEYAEDHLPGAINLPALSNAERAEIGTLYVQDSAFKARKKGAALVARNVAAHLEGPLKDKDGGWQPLIYCWRGGQRSGSFASILSQIGWRAETIAGGYQSYRRLVFRYLYEDALPFRLVLLDGNTGTGKTALLARLSDRGYQTLDLEALAAHRGSLLGAIQTDQPAQKAFETALAAALVHCDPTKPVIIEAESSKIGTLNLPQGLWKAMCAAPRIMVTASLTDRAAFLTQTYDDISQDREQLRARLQPLRYIRGHAPVEAWEKLLEKGDLDALSAALIRDHYDPAYAKSRGSQTFRLLGTVHAEDLTDSGLNRAADRIAECVNQATADPAYQ